jgi:hypothetical protein
VPLALHPSPIRRGVVRLGFALTGLLLGASARSAQPLTSIFVRPGERVRVTTREHTPMDTTRVGVLYEARRDSVTVVFRRGGRGTLPLDGLARAKGGDEYFPPAVVAAVTGVVGALAGAVPTPRRHWRIAQQGAGGRALLKGGLRKLGEGGACRKGPQRPRQLPV